MAVETTQETEESLTLHQASDVTDPSLPRLRYKVSPSLKHNVPEKRTHARSHLVSSLRDRGLKGPLKWSRRVSEVKIPNYRTECRSLGDPLLFTKSHRLPTALAKREEFLMDTPLATFSYHVQSSSANPKRKLQQPLLGREVTLTEIRRMMSRVSPETKPPEISRISSSLPPHTSAATRSTSSDLIDSSGLKISIQDTDTNTSLPQIRLTIKQEPDKEALSRLRRNFKSPSWGPDNSPGWSAPKNQELDSVREMLLNHSEHTKSGSKGAPTGRSKRGRQLGLSSLDRQPKMDRVKEWVYKSPLDTAPVEDPTAMAFRSQKPSRRVRFGGRDWVYKDKAYMFD